MSFTTVDEVALFLNRAKADLTTLELAQINLTIPYMDGVINNYCGWNMLATDYTNKRFDGSGTKQLDLRLYPVNSVTQVRVRAADGTFTDVTDGIEILEDGIIQFTPFATTSMTTFTAGTKNWYVSFNAGFTAATPELPGPPVVPATPGNVPTELAYAANFLTSIHFNKIIDENMSSEEEKFEGITFKNATLELPVTVKRALDRFRMVSIF